MTAAVYLTRAAKFLPNNPVDNDNMEEVLGMIGGKPSRARKITLRNNGIRTRYYAISRYTGELRYTNAQLTAEAVRALTDDEFQLDDIQLLSCGTSSPDQVLPNHALMVHGELGNQPCETSASSGICLAGLLAMKYGYMAIAAGLARNAVTTGSELFSTLLRAQNFTPESDAKVDELEREPGLAFGKDFLRWMLSDGAGAILLSDTPNAHGLSMRIDWIEMRSYANEYETCMYLGTTKQADGNMRGWRENTSLQDAVDSGAFAFEQDVKLLNPNITPVLVGRGLPDILKQHKLDPDEVDWFLPHFSSYHFHPILQQCLRDIGFEIPAQRWFINLERVGNVGAASMYLMVEELLNGGRCRAGDVVLCFVPESGRFSTGFMKMTVVDASGSASRH
ncbi:beta-ketoacyl-ACP synthase III [Mesorhizobium sp. NPDC059025]|uniref:beta-ketoacyl-ACP synthase III n=1 Tax=unclassified Mesorhizobium TaxID=325217 RepID=UPI0036AE7C0A